MRFQTYNQVVKFMKRVGIPTPFRIDAFFAAGFAASGAREAAIICGYRNTKGEITTISIILNSSDKISGLDFHNFILNGDVYINPPTRTEQWFDIEFLVPDYQHKRETL